VEAETGLSWLRIGTGGWRFECDNELSDSIKCGEFIDYLKACQLFRKESAPWNYLVKILY